MNTKIALAFGVALLVAAISWNVGENAASGQDQPNAQDQKQQDQQKSDALKQAKIAYARALLKGAQADLAKAREANSRVRETIPSSIVRGLQTDVAVATARVNSMMGAEGGGNPDVLSGKESLTFAEERLQEATSANTRAPGAISPAEVARRQADVELARSRLEVAKLLDAAPPLEVARWELLQLQEDVHDLRYRVRLLQYRN